MSLHYEFNTIGTEQTNTHITLIFVWFVTTQSNSSVDVALSSAETSCRRVPDHVSVSRIAYFKRKFVDVDDEASLSFRTYCQSVSDHTLKLDAATLTCVLAFLL